MYAVKDAQAQPNSLLPALWDDVLNEILVATLDTQRRAQAAKEGSELQTNHAYGSTFWVALLQEVNNRVSTLEGAVTIPSLDHFPYPLTVLESCLIYPVRCNSSTQGPDKIVLSHSGTRSNILSIHDVKHSHIQGTLDFGPGFVDDNDLSRVHAAIQGFNRTILVVVDCDDRAGLQHIYFGEVGSFGLDGIVKWGWYKEAPLSSLLGRTSVTLADPDAGAFDAAPEPSVQLRVRGGATLAASGEVIQFANGGKS